MIRAREHKKWTKSEENQLEWMADRGMSTKTIAKRLERTEDAIYNKAGDLNKSLKPKD